ncbi:NADP-dependent phosphogluconate dehydrogenase [Candidatus Annandia pinicola]|uniref:NADP-dependent phosphogluconate dehydrogenase n=1 Tax=Candidatus Annandia pinicola TaxID=1345117 RepID=UPI001D02A955|nr:NADP-dependent phosphogluconate dehydrogenase [Candidatus Annandia pinicola]UDG80418.1 6-phosphogluconate dehydrogenase, decarboxylating [Candidatus Annandia pinicola]
MKKKQNFGIIGMAVMGKNLALNIANNSYKVSVYNRSEKKIKEIVDINNKNIIPFNNIKKFINSLTPPKTILLMIKSGKATKDTIKKISKYLKPHDVIIDGGNSFYKDTMEISNFLFKKHIKFIGAGISGGEYGALNGPSIMPGGSLIAYKITKHIFKKISALSEENFSCICYLGPNGSGHYIKMIHNGIEYGNMQLIAESYFMLKYFFKYDNKKISNLFSEWNKHELNSYLIEITKQIIKKKNKNNKDYLINSISDVADSKGTGKWSVKNSLDLGEPFYIAAASLFERYISCFKKERKLLSKIFIKKQKISNYNITVEHIRKSLYLSTLISYIQGFNQLRLASLKYNWNLKLGKIAKIWFSGCIIKSRCLKNIEQEFLKDEKLSNLMFSDYFKDTIDSNISFLRKTVLCAIDNSISIPAFNAALTFFDSYTSKELSTNLVQAQRDCFGSHRYIRNDKKGYFHTHWIKE